MAKRRRAKRIASSTTARRASDATDVSARAAESLSEIATASAMQAVGIATGVARGMAKGVAAAARELGSAAGDATGAATRTAQAITEGAARGAERGTTSRSPKMPRGRRRRRAA